MITKENFIECINEYQSFIDEIEKISEVISGSKYGLNLFECKWYLSVDKIFDIFLNTHFTEAGCDLIYWWLFEDVDHIITSEIQPDLFNTNVEITHDVNELSGLWNFMTLYPNDYFKDV